MMKKITLLVVAILVGITTFAQTTLTHSLSETITPGITVACPTEPTSYLRVFDLVNEFGINTGFEITTVEFGVEVSETADITVNLYTADGLDPTVAALSLIYSGTQATVDGAKAVHTLADPVIVPPGSIIVFELAESIDGTIFRIGSNADGQTAPSWLISGTCGAGTVDSFGFTNHYVVNIIGDPDTSGIADNIIDGFSMYPNPVVDVLNLNANTTIDTVSIFNMLGQEVLTSNQTKIDMSVLPTGSYIVKVQAGEQVASYNLVKE